MDCVIVDCSLRACYTIFLHINTLPTYKHSRILATHMYVFLSSRASGEHTTISHWCGRPIVRSYSFFSRLSMRQHLNYIIKTIRCDCMCSCFICNTQQSVQVLSIANCKYSSALPCVLCVLYSLI